MIMTLLTPPSSSLPIGEIPSAHLEICGDGSPVLLLHGWGCSGDLFKTTIGRLQGAFTLIVPDMPGCGRTPDPPISWGVDDYAAWVIALLDRLGLEKVDIIGHSFGGRVALKLAVERPERVDRLVLTGSSGIRPRRTLRYHLLVRSYKTLRRLSKLPLAPPLLRRLADRQAARRGSTDYQAASGTVRSSFVKIVNEDQRPTLARVQASTLLIWGENDQDAPLADGRTMESLIPDAGLVVFEGAGHFAYIERSDRFCRIVAQFLARDEV